MRIGKFSNINNISIDTIRHYMDLRLIIPENIGGQYFFDERCEKSLKDIFYIKNMKFFLRNIYEHLLEG